MGEISLSFDAKTINNPISRECRYFWHIECFIAYIPKRETKTQAFYIFIFVCRAEKSAIEVSELLSFFESKLLRDGMGCKIFSKHSFSHYGCGVRKGMSIYLCCI